MKKTTLIIGMLLCLFVAVCKPQKHGKGGSQQPKKGPMPCPIKDC